MALVNDRINASKPQPAAADPKTGKLAAGQINNSKDLEVDPKKEEPSFFGSFFASAKGAPKKKTGPVMEAVSATRLSREYTQNLPCSRQLLSNLKQLSTSGRRWKRK